MLKVEDCTLHRKLNFLLDRKAAYFLRLVHIELGTVLNSCEQLCALACSPWLGTVVNGCEYLCAVACSQKSVHNIVFSLVVNCRNALRKL